MSYHHQRGSAAQYYLDTSAEYMEEDDTGGHVGGRRLSSSGGIPSQGGRSHPLSSTSSGFGISAGGSGSSPTKIGRHESFEQNDYQDEAEVHKLDELK